MKAIRFILILVSLVGVAGINQVLADSLTIDWYNNPGSLIAPSLLTIEFNTVTNQFDSFLIVWNDLTFDFTGMAYSHLFAWNRLQGVIDWRVDYIDPDPNDGLTTARFQITAGPAIVPWVGYVIPDTPLPPIAGGLAFQGRIPQHQNQPPSSSAQDLEHWDWLRIAAGRNKGFLQTIE